MFRKCTFSLVSHFLLVCPMYFVVVFAGYLVDLLSKIFGICCDVLVGMQELEENLN